jgi:LPXTG-motif cell wall-anchored protein
VGGTILTAVGGSQSQMLVVAGICLLLGACAVFIIKETIGEKK